jgi:hypothetical protein
VVGGSTWALTLAIPTTTTGAPALVYLSDQFMATADPARRAVFTTAVETLIAQNRTTVVVDPLTTVGLLIVSIVMLKGVFPKAVAYLGVAGRRPRHLRARLARCSWIHPDVTRPLRVSFARRMLAPADR